MAVGGDNFLIPVNVKSTTRRDLDVGGVKLTEIINILNESAPQAVHFIVFDACRNNLGGNRGGKGFVPVAEKPGMLIAFSTTPGVTASDEGKDSGHYAAALAAELVQPGLNHGDMFFEVRTRVATSTAQEQIPWTQDGLMRRVQFGSAIAKLRTPPLPADGLYFSDQLGNFKVAFPKGLVPIEGPKKEGQSHNWTASLADGQFMSVAYSDAIEGRKPSIEAAIKVVGDKFGKIVRINNIEQHGLAGREIILVTSETPVFRWRFFAVGARLYQVFYRGPSGSENDSQVETFLDSFELLARDREGRQ